MKTVAENVVQKTFFFSSYEAQYFAKLLNIWLILQRSGTPCDVIIVFIYTGGCLFLLSQIITACFNTYSI